MILHSDTAEPGRCEVYWDHGPLMIKLFNEQHGVACSNNWICNGLNLATTVVQDKKGVIKFSPIPNLVKNIISEVALVIKVQLQEAYMVAKVS